MPRWFALLEQSYLSYYFGQLSTSAARGNAGIGVNLRNARRFLQDAEDFRDIDDPRAWVLRARVLLKCGFQKS
jgi:hypothetical protein